MTLPARDPFDEGQRLHRARRARELARRDDVLMRADIILQAALRKTAEILLALHRGRFFEAPEMMGGLMKELDAARQVLIDYYDRPDGGVDDGEN